MPELKRLSPRHDAIMEWLVANPTASKAECARTFGVTQAWLSSIIHSGAFQAAYAELRGDYRDDRILPLLDRIHGLAHRSVERLEEKVDETESEDFLLEVFTKATDRLGLSGRQRDAGGGNVSVVVQNSVSAGELAEARQRLAALQGRPQSHSEESPAILPTENEKVYPR